MNEQPENRSASPSDEVTGSPIETRLPSLANQLEALLFASSGPVSASQLGAALELNTRDIEDGLNLLEQQLSQRGLRLQWHSSKVQMTTAPEYAPAVERFLGLEAATRLSKAALESLAIIAYQQPITRPEIDSIRGVNSDGVLKSLLSKGLIEEAGRAERIGRPILFVTTADFLSHFGLSSIKDLPPLADFETTPKDAGFSPETLLKT